MAKSQSTFTTLVAAGALIGLVVGSLPAPKRHVQVPLAVDEDSKDATSASVEQRVAGAGAEGPSDIPAAGWWNVFKRVLTGFSSDRVMANAAGVTFYALLALFPAIASLISLYGLIADPATLGDQVQGLSGIVPAGGIDIIKDEITALTSSDHKALGFGAVIGILTSLWSANAGVKAFFDALNVVYHEQEKRNFFWLTLGSLCFTLGIIVFVIVALFTVVVIPIALNFMGLAGATDLLIRVARWPVMMVIVAFILSIMYRYGPSRRRARWQWVSWGSFFAAATWIAFSFAFSFYVAHFGSYNKTYGSLGAVVGFMTWIWISSMVVLVGAEINAELEHQTRRDSTEGPDRPIGERGAYKANVKG